MAKINREGSDYDNLQNGNLCYRYNLKNIDKDFLDCAVKQKSELKKTESGQFGNQ